MALTLFDSQPQLGLGIKEERMEAKIDNPFFTDSARKAYEQGRKAGHADGTKEVVEVVDPKMNALGTYLSGQVRRDFDAWWQVQKKQWNISA